MLDVAFTGESGGLFRTDSLGGTWTNFTGDIDMISSDTEAFDAAVYNDGATRVVTVVLSGTEDNEEVKAIFRPVDGAAFERLDIPLVFDDFYVKVGIVADKTNSNLACMSGGTGGKIDVNAHLACSSPYSGSETPVMTMVLAPGSPVRYFLKAYIRSGVLWKSSCFSI